MVIYITSNYFFLSKGVFQVAFAVLARVGPLLLNRWFQKWRPRISLSSFTTHRTGLSYFYYCLVSFTYGFTNVSASFLSWKNKLTLILVSSALYLKLECSLINYSYINFLFEATLQCPLFFFFSVC